MTTKELAAKFGVKPASIHSMYYAFGHYRNYVPTGKRANRQHTWVKDFGVSEELKTWSTK